jgi:lipopolysaccharide transport system ATP-binding protein
MKRAEIERKFDEIVDFAEVEKFIDTPVKHYSSGIYVRLALWNRPLLQSLSWNMTYSTGLAFAVAAHLEPEILLVDEVLVVGDATTSSHCDTLTRTGKLS